MKIGRVHDSQHPSRLRRVFGQWLSILALTVFFLTTSSIFIPDRSLGNRSSTNEQNPSSTRFQTDDNSAADGLAFQPFNSGDLPVIGELVCKSQRIRILAAMPEPLYTILSIDGAVIASRLTASEVALRFPDLPLLSPVGGISSDSSSGPEYGSARDGELPLMSDVPTDNHE